MVGKDGETFVDALQKADEKMQQLEVDDKVLEDMETELQAAGKRLEDADARYHRVFRQLAEELAKPLDFTPAPRYRVWTAEQEADNQDEAETQADTIGHTLHGTKDQRNTSARTDKEVSSSRWLAKRSRELRVREEGRRAHDRLRCRQRDRKKVFAEVDQEGEPSAPVVEEPKTEDLKKHVRVRLALDAAVVKQGAQGIATRLESIAARPNPKEKRSALQRTLIGGRAGYYRFTPKEILDDLKERGVLDDKLHGEFRSLLKDQDATKGSSVPPEEWLTHAQKMRSVERVDDQPFREVEFQYFRSVDEKALIDAEAELDVAEDKLRKALQNVDARWPSDQNQRPNPKSVKSQEPDIDFEYAERLQVQLGPNRDNRGSKNTSALSEKVVSSEKWLAARDAESRDREHQKKVRDTGRSEARDRKHGAADVADD